MKVGAVLAAIVLACGALAATYWIARTPTVGPHKTAAAGSDEPVPAEKGPHPKAVVPEMVYEFGVMRMGESQEHEFIVRNEGKAPLKLGTPQTTCQCTVSEAAKKPIPPGGEGTITLKWTPAVETETFDKGAMIRTNDPKMPEIRLRVVGKVEQLLLMEPNGTWKIGDVTDRENIEVAGFIFSRLLDSFEIESIESSNPLLKAKAIPISEEEMTQHEAKSGYKIAATLEPGMPVGRFQEKLTIKTDIKDNEKASKLEIPVEGTRQGPVVIIPTPGVKWRPDSLAVDLGTFPASEGAVAKLSLFLTGSAAEDEFKFESVDTSVPAVEVSLEPDDSSQIGDRKRYELTFRVAPGSPPQAHRAKGAVKVEVKTNHPEASEMKFFVEFISRP